MAVAFPRPFQLAADLRGCISTSSIVTAFELRQHPTTARCFTGVYVNVGPRRRRTFGTGNELARTRRPLNRYARVEEPPGGRSER